MQAPRVDARPRTIPVGAIERICRDCDARFAISVEEQVWYRQQADAYPGGWSLPRRCPQCRSVLRAARRRLGSSQDEVRTCRICGDTFVFTARERALFNRRDWAPPHRCPTCRG